MALESEIYCIWLDTHIGVPGQCLTLQQMFQSGLMPITSMPPDSIRNLILCFDEQVSPIKFVATIDDALTLIQHETEKRIILISSGTLGGEIVPFASKNYARCYSFYIFCGNITHHMDWTMDYIDCIQMFDHEIDLLIRLIRDISKEFIERGVNHLENSEYEKARNYFVAAETLETNANNTNGAYQLKENLCRLKGPNGLINRAETSIEIIINTERSSDRLPLNHIQFIIVGLTQLMDSTNDSILHYLQLIIPSNTLCVMSSSSRYDITQKINNRTLLFTSEKYLSEIGERNWDYNNLEIFTLDDSANSVDSTQRFATVNELIDKLVNEIVEKYRTQAVEHEASQQMDIAIQERNLADDIKHHVMRLRE